VLGDNSEIVIWVLLFKEAGSRYACISHTQSACAGGTRAQMSLHVLGDGWGEVLEGGGIGWAGGDEEGKQGHIA
jgi:hypothetical protein